MFQSLFGEDIVAGHQVDLDVVVAVGRIDFCLDEWLVVLRALAVMPVILEHLRVGNVFFMRHLGLEVCCDFFDFCDYLDFLINWHLWLHGKINNVSLSVNDHL